MKTLAKLTWVEIKLFARDPITMVFTLALPVIFLFVMGEVFGNVADPDVYRGVGPMDHYTPAYIGLVIAAIGVVALPVHLTSYRERGVLRRLRASPVPLRSVFGAHVLVGLIIAVAGAVVLVALAGLAYDVKIAQSLPLFLAMFLASVLSFAAVGFFLGAVLPTARAAQGVGLVLYFVMLLLSGAGPPREVMTEAMRWIGDITPLPHVVLLLQDPWLGLGWNAKEFAVVAAFGAAASFLALRFFRWE